MGPVSSLVSGYCNIAGEGLGGDPMSLEIRSLSDGMAGEAVGVDLKAGI